MQARALLADLPDPYAVAFKPIKMRDGTSASATYRQRKDCETGIRGALQIINETFQRFSSDVGAQVLEKLNSEGDATLKLISKAADKDNIKDLRI